MIYVVAVVFPIVAIAVGIVVGAAVIKFVRDIHSENSSGHLPKERKFQE